jgi:signal transduction histidine kinase
MDQSSSDARILVVEDEAITALALAHSVERCGYRVIGTAANGIRALDLAAELAPDLVLMDISLADSMDGITTATKLRDGFDIPVVFLSAHEASDVVERAQLARPLGFLVKPFQDATLKPMLQLALSRAAYDKQSSELQRMRERFTAELQLEGARRTAEQQRMLTEIESFTYSLAHDLRAPIRAVHAYAGMLREAPAAVQEDDALRLVDRIRAAATRMEGLVDGLLSLGRLAVQPLDLAPVDMTQLANQVAQKLRARYPATEIDVGDLPTITGDIKMLASVWHSLIDNACKFSATAARPRVEIAAGSTPSGCQYWVCDNGVGFDSAHAEKVFGLFERAHAAGEFSGEGYGLALATRIVQRHGGRMRADPMPRGGACVSMEIPLAIEAAAANSAAAASLAASAALPGGRLASSAVAAAPVRGVEPRRQRV